MFPFVEKVAVMLCSALSNGWIGIWIRSGYMPLLLEVGFGLLSSWLRAGKGVIHSTGSCARASARFGFISNIVAAVRDFLTWKDLFIYQQLNWNFVGSFTCLFINFTLSVIEFGKRDYTVKCVSLYNDGSIWNGNVAAQAAWQLKSSQHRHGLSPV